MLERRAIAIQIDLASPVAAYRQIADAIRAVLVTGKLTAGAKLPTIRTLAIQLGVHPNTVAEAYRLLSEEDWIELGRRRGATVIARATPRASTDDTVRFGQRLRALVAEARSAGVPLRSIRRELETLAQNL